MTSYVYLHGFASSPASSKAQYFRARLAARGVTLAIPELDGGDFEHLTLSGQLDVVDRCVGDGPAVLLGSSMGGYLAALYAERHTAVERVVLLAPAFDFRARWAKRLGVGQMGAWKTTGTMRVYHYGQKAERELDYRLFEDAGRYPAYPDVQQPTLIFQGLEDDIVPPEVARTYGAGHPDAQLHWLASGHELTNVLPEMWALCEEFLFP